MPSQEITPAERPLNQSQIKNLKELVEGDYRDLLEQITVDIQNRESRRREAIEERYRNVADLEAARQKLIEAGRKAEDMLKAIVDEVTNGNIKVHQEEYRQVQPFKVSTNPSALVQEGRDRELKKLHEAARRLDSIATKIINREKRASMRTVLLQGVGAGGALELIADLPKGPDIMALVAREMMETSEDDLKALMMEEEFEAAKAIETESE